MKTPKTTILDYIDWRGDISFDLDGINEVDCLIFATLAYIDFSLTPFVNTLDLRMAPTIAEIYDSMSHVKGSDKQFMTLLCKCAKSKRFKNVEVFAYESIIDEEQHTQFCAVSFFTPHREAVITFRGTDDSLVGWEEDLKMSFSKIPAQSYAQSYANKVASNCQEIPFYITGHSKGGNLAIWAGAHLSDDNFKRLVKIYDNDGPGFCGEFTKSAGYNRIMNKTLKFVVDSSIIGMFLDSDTDQKIVASNEMSTLMQHYPMSWIVLGKKFYTLEDRSAVGKATDSVIKEWLSTLSYDERKQVTEIIFEILRSSNAKTLSQLRGADAPKKIVPMLKAYSDTDKEKKQFLLSIIGRLKGILKKRAISIFDNILE
ncbi:MAG: DUF2974 domain-containing protein [Ruminococcaceae bacterium]|nr:DUF2974 domain-containing protein [Oscillospiraceae bacterium]